MPKRAARSIRWSRETGRSFLLMDQLTDRVRAALATRYAIEREIGRGGGERAAWGVDEHGTHVRIPRANCSDRATD